MSFLLSWFIQDLLQVFLIGNVLVPEYFLVSLAYPLLLEKEEFRKVLWISFFGGLLWDLRWTGLWGLTAGIYSFCIIFLHWIWTFFPSSGRTPWLFFSLCWFATLLVSALRIFVWNRSGIDLPHAFIVQQLCTVPLMIFLSIMFSRRIASENV